MALNILRKFQFPSIVAMTNFQQIRTTYVVKRRNPAPLRKPQKQPSLRGRHYVFETIEDNVPKPQKIIKVLLRKYVDDVGQPGEIVSVKEQIGRLLIMTHKAAYANKENLDRFGADTTTQPTFSSKYVATTIQVLSKFVLNVSMNKETPWNLEPWHIRNAFRKAGVYVPDSAITMPDNIITGPDIVLEGKEFYVTITINETEKVVVRCRIHHWATNLGEKLPRVRDHWKFPAENIFPEDKQVAQTLPEIVPPVLEDDDFIPPVRRKIGRK